LRHVGGGPPRPSRWEQAEHHFHDGQLFDLKDAPFVETAVSASASDSRKRLQAVLDELQPVGGAS
jgi:hypothetical protein